MVTVIDKSKVKKEKKFSLPIVNKFICCCCMPLKSAIGLCTTLILVLFFLRMVNIIKLFEKGVDILSILKFLAYLITCICLLLYLIGSFKKNVKLMKPLKYFWIVSIIAMIPSLYNRYIISTTDIMDDNIKSIFKEQGEQITDKEIKLFKMALVLFELACVIFILYYYYAACSYLYTLEEEQREQEERREMEENKFIK
ncbi:hypothetical protein BCR36DRAFT_411438 [Piromyces finnis]|uniref:Lysosomal cobalamin transporter n=1 Tax=Piromyces finnis TaxID=1754191 RepID=A0A1Y1VC40_9FUNG|nr:hypothetical protein BCR36DRAFT_411438 [Piromyces finnis]|eukprot:ORX52543.1 hypothetical protein BCR36DRAFT_411438 [Piromyces finnis]